MIPQGGSLHFIGICGTAMASVAAALKTRGYRITGSDTGVYPPMSDFLRERGIEITSPFSESNLSHAPDLIVVGNAISRGNPEVERALQERRRLVSLPDLVNQTVLQRSRNLVVSGTHGKTTTSSLLTWILVSAGLDPSFLIGGIAENLGEGARFTEGPFTVVEGDEYDSAFFDKRSKFIHYAPEVAIFNNLEFDHADIFDSLAQIQRSFLHFARLTPRNGRLLVNGDDPNLEEIRRFPHAPVTTFGFGEQCDARIEALGSDETGVRFRLDAQEYQSPLFGAFNLRNAAAAICAARHVGVAPAAIQTALSSFQGIKRRMTIRGEKNGIMVIDDFAHHPTAIAETLRALRSRFSDRRLLAVFEPRSNTTRRKRFQQELADALSLADAAFIGQVARIDQLPEDDRLNIRQLSADTGRTGRPAEAHACTDQLVARLREFSEPGDVIAIMSNGGFDGIHQKLLDALETKPG